MSARGISMEIGRVTSGKNMVGWVYLSPIKVSKGILLLPREMCFTGSTQNLHSLLKSKFSHILKFKVN
jgi:hypothetical protein